MNTETNRAQRLSIQAKADGRAVVACARQDTDVDVLSCQLCAHCIGLSVRDAYLVCGWQKREQATAKGTGHPMKRSDIAPSGPGDHGAAPSASAPQITTIALGLGRFERAVVTATLDDTAHNVACRMRDQHVGCVVVVRDGHPVGMLTDRDLVLRVIADALDPQTTLVSSIVTYDAVTVLRTDGFETVMRTMREHGVRRVPIVDETGRLTGIVTADDLVALLGRELAALGEAISCNVDGSESR
jgi:CBS domain-containing protein